MGLTQWEKGSAPDRGAMGGRVGDSNFVLVTCSRYSEYLQISHSLLLRRITRIGHYSASTFCPHSRSELCLTAVSGMSSFKISNSFAVPGSQRSEHPPKKVDEIPDITLACMTARPLVNCIPGKQHFEDLPGHRDVESSRDGVGYDWITTQMHRLRVFSCSLFS